jgi:SAM-dependent methyltransferase
MDFRRATRRVLVFSASTIAIATMAATLVCFPWSLDPQRDDSVNTRHFYEKAYAKGQAFEPASAAPGVAPLSEKEQFYTDLAQKTALQSRVPEMISGFVHRFGLKDKKILEIGAGSGLLQDSVADYTALDISPTARRFFHKPFVEASATDMPFPDNTFDALWSIWVLEHIPNPEKALLEMRRVLKPGGYMFLMPAFNVGPYAAQGYAVRPYRDFDWRGRLIKATVPVFRSNAFHYLQYHQVLALRSLTARLGSGPSHLHFVRLTPNYDQYWQPDSDAVCSVSSHELYLWFITRGDRCVNCPSELRMTFRDVDLFHLIIQTVKR